jgi:hypothetical protein
MMSFVNLEWYQTNTVAVAHPCPATLWTLANPFNTATIYTLPFQLEHIDFVFPVLSQGKGHLPSNGSDLPSDDPDQLPAKKVLQHACFNIL